MKSFSLNLPINQVSFGQVSTAFLRGFYDRGIEPPLFSIGGTIDLSSQKEDQKFFNWVSKLAQKSYSEHKRSNPTLKLWHFNGGLESLSKEHHLLTFYELDEPTKSELNVAKSCDRLIFTNNYSKEIFSHFNVDSEVISLPFDRYNFNVTNKKYFDDDRIVFNLCGKFEKRKHHEKIIKTWAKRFGNDKRYFLQCAVYNSFLNEEQNKELFARSVDNVKYYNIHFLGFMPQNVLYNDYLNSGDIIIAMSGGEGWGLPEFHSVGLGTHAVTLNAHSYREWATEENSVLVQPSGKIEAYDGIFFKKGSEFNQGRIYDFHEDEFIAACEKAIQNYQSNPVNENGLKIQEKFSIENSVDRILELL